MKVIDLLNKIAKGEEVPKEIEYQGAVYVFDEKDYKLFKGANLLSKNCLTTYINAVMLNDEIEIIEEKPKKIEELKSTISYYFTYEDERLTEDFSGISKHLITNIDKINELTKVVNYLLEKESDK